MVVRGIYCIILCHYGIQYMEKTTAFGQTGYSSVTNKMEARLIRYGADGISINKIYFKKESSVKICNLSLGNGASLLGTSSIFH